MQEHKGYPVIARY